MKQCTWILSKDLGREWKYKVMWVEFVRKYLDFSITRKVALNRKY